MGSRILDTVTGSGCDRHDPYHPGTGNLVGEKDIEQVTTELFNNAEYMPISQVIKWQLEKVHWKPST